MSTLLTDLHRAIDDVLSRHQRLDRRDALRGAIEACLSEPLEEQAFITRVCELFNAVVVTV